MDLGLDGRAYVVTGASSGVGLATAAALLREGAHVAACARDEERLRRALDPLPRAAGARVFAAACDVVDGSAVEAFTVEAARRFGRIDGVVNNAGRSLMASVAETSETQWREEFDLKIFSVLNTIRAAEPYLRASDAPAVVNVNAILARQPEPRLGATSAARAALLNLTRTLSGDLVPIRVNSVCLGLVDTGQWRRRYDTAATGQSYEEWSAGIAADRGIALGRLGRADEVAYPIVALLSPRASYITGSTIDVGGGVSRYV
ncbi:SDR family oxidoreductase [Actinoallomurus iriomotensis]|uniref:Short-chain dehydrogenase/reductase n=1 Tax=Actinoallomurus iriomotensis TaxID=478107 RepID=A0A9W6RMF2_9ACTN|nr:SDR family oxidoreductase [Actinoallomurus iriomotensis]GLY77760.1 short-chain dehydrogenase/reductase [Actinoallomurus iriomotensis]